MDAILLAVASMGDMRIIHDSTRIMEVKIEILCGECRKHRVVTAGAIYRQYVRGGKCYLCPSCAGKKGWTKDKRQAASINTKKKWSDPSYAGTVEGKAIANSITKDTTIPGLG